MIRYVYIGQYGFYWRLSLDEFRKLCEGIIDGEGYYLSSWCRTPSKRSLGVPLRRMPRSCYKQRWMQAASSKDPERPIYHPLDWTPGNAREYLIDVFGESLVNN